MIYHNQAYMFYNKLQYLPAAKQAEVFDFIDFMLTKYHVSELEIKPKIRPKSGFLDVFVMKPGFDEPLDCFNDYMPD